MNIYHIALGMISGLGNKGLRELIQLQPEAEEIYNLSHSQLTDIFGRHTGIIEAIERRTTLAAAERAARELEEKHIRTLFFTDDEYPQRMNRLGCEDCPALLYVLGTCNLNSPHAIAMVGTRKATEYGRTTATRLVDEVKNDNPVIVSGLAYGIDTVSHTAALDCGLPTVAVLGHGLDRIYPPQNRELAANIVAAGGALVTEYPLGAKISATNFPARNRIIAAMSDATVVVEAAERGGALITAHMALGYNRDVFAVPGHLDAPYSAGCNNLIATNKAILVRNGGDICFQMGWRNTRALTGQAGAQQSLFAELTADESHITALLADHREMTLDEMVALSGMSMPKVASLIMDLEMKKAIHCLPGHLYKLV